MANSYDVGDLVKLTATFTTAGVAADPTAVSVKYKNPAGTTTTKVYGTDVEVVKSSTGIYYIYVSAATEGRWYYRWYSTGTGQAAGESYFDVAQTYF